MYFLGLKPKWVPLEIELQTDRRSDKNGVDIPKKFHRNHDAVSRDRHFRCHSGDGGRELNGKNETDGECAFTFLVKIERTSKVYFGCLLCKLMKETIS